MDNNQEIFVLNTCDAWHTHKSMRIVGCFTSLGNIQEYLSNELNREQLACLIIDSQTQGLEQNYIILTEKLNPLS